MVCVKAEGKELVYTDMPGHWDLGSPSISPDGKTVAFDALTIGVSPQRQSWLVGIDGKGLRELANGATPRWSPDGKRLVITRDVPAGFFGLGERTPWLFEIELATGKQRRLCEGRFGDWSPDGLRLAFARGGARVANSGVHPGSKLFIAKADGSDPEELCSGDWPSWSPNGKKLAFYLEKGPQSRVFYIHDLETKKQTELGSGFYRAQWAGDGQSVVSNGIWDVIGDDRFARAPARFRLDKPGKPEFFMTDFDNPWSPCVSPDGKTIALVVDSERRRRPPDGFEEDEKK
jgi:Tol biopolymer transport system component